MSKIYTSTDQLIGGTPLLELSHIEKAEKLEAKLLAKLVSLQSTMTGIKRRLPERSSRIALPRPFLMTPRRAAS